MRNHVLSIPLLLLALVAGLPALAAPPAATPDLAPMLPQEVLLTFRGQVTDAEGAPLIGHETLVFRLYDADTGGDALWEEEHEVDLDDGWYTVVLGSKHRLALQLDHDYVLLVRAASLDESLAEEYQVAVAVQEPTGSREVASGATGVYRIVVRASGEQGEGDSRDEDSEESVGSKSGQKGHGKRKKKKIKQIVSLDRSILTTPSDGYGDRGRIELRANPAVVQRRVADPCPKGTALQAIEEDGSPVCVDLPTGRGTLDQSYDRGGPGNGRRIYADAGPVWVSGPDGLVVDGKVGIGTSEPRTPLDVAGHVVANNGYLVGNPVTSGIKVLHGTVDVDFAGETMAHGTIDFAEEFQEPPVIVFSEWNHSGNWIIVKTDRVTTEQFYWVARLVSGAATDYQTKFAWIAIGK